MSGNPASSRRLAGLRRSYGPQAPLTKVELGCDRPHRLHAAQFAQIGCTSGRQFDTPPSPRPGHVVDGLVIPRWPAHHQPPPSAPTKKETTNDNPS